jgi:rubrerythrin
MISTRIIYKKVIFQHICSSCGYIWKDDINETDICPNCTQPSCPEEHRFATLREPDIIPSEE